MKVLGGLLLVMGILFLVIGVLGLLQEGLLPGVVSSLVVGGGAVACFFWLKRRNWKVR